MSSEPTDRVESRAGAYTLTDRDVHLIVDSLRANESHGKRGFLRWLTKNMSRPEAADKLARANDFFRELTALREKFGDLGPVEAKLE